jgi:hypothetical protein
MREITRREAMRVLGTASAGAWVAAHSGLGLAMGPKPRPETTKDEQTPPLAPGASTSPQRTALIEAFKHQSDGLQNKYEARSYKGEFTMPYRLFRPEASGKLPLVVYLHGSGGLGDDNQKQLGLGNIFGTRVWLLPENQKKFPCYVVVPQTDRGWVRYDLTQEDNGRPKILSGLGDGNRVLPANRWEAQACGTSSPIVRTFSPLLYPAAAAFRSMTALARWTQRCGPFMAPPTRPSPSLSRASASRRDARPADVRSTPSMPVSTMRFGSGLTPSRPW